jgi:hypothetical protein
MSTNEVSSCAATSRASAKVDLKLEVVVISVSDLDRAKHFYGGSAGGSTPTFASIVAYGSSSSHRPARDARCNSARTSRRPRPARPTGT